MIINVLWRECSILMVISQYLGELIYPWQPPYALCRKQLMFLFQAIQYRRQGAQYYVVLVIEHMLNLGAGEQCTILIDTTDILNNGNNIEKNWEQEWYVSFFFADRYRRYRLCLWGYPFNAEALLSVYTLPALYDWVLWVTPPGGPSIEIMDC